MKKPLAALAVIVAAMAAAYTSGAVPSSPSSVGDASCDDDGVQVSYANSYGTTPPPNGYRVVTVVVSGISPSCQGIGGQAAAELTVDLKATSAVVGSAGPTPVNNTTMTLSVDTPPRSAGVDEVYVELDGGSIPVPAECTGMTFDLAIDGTNGRDKLTGDRRRNIIHGLLGDDDITGDDANDCLSSGGGLDRSNGGKGDDVILGADGNDDLKGDAGQDKMYGGNGDDRVDGTTGNDTLFGGPGNDVVMGGVGNDALDGGPGVDECHSNGGNDTFVNCEKVFK